jgi:hypothetical protein
MLANRAALSASAEMRTGCSHFGITPINRTGAEKASQRSKNGACAITGRSCYGGGKVVQFRFSRSGGRSMAATLQTRRSVPKSLAGGTTVLAAPGPVRAQSLAKIRFGTNWIAEAEHGGYYQAIADGTYARAGLDVEIVMGGPQSNNRLLFYTRNRLCCTNRLRGFIF